MLTDELYIRRCLQIARNGIIGAPSNPMVGAVIVCGDRIIGEGYHARCGEGHAEVNAFRSVRPQDEHLIPQSTIYVSLEPCAHYGKTPPCAELIVRKGVKRVVVGCVDPFAKVQGRGIEIIRKAGIDVTVGVLEEECLRLIERFVTFHTLSRPFVTLKWAQTADGVMGIQSAPDAAPLLISTPVTMRRVHHLRATHKAILVGYNTAMLDNPSLTTRHYHGPNPMRIVIDPRGELSPSLRIFNHEAPTLVFGHHKNPSVAWNETISFVPLCPEQPTIPQILTHLHERNIQSLLVEGGRSTLQSFINAGLWDEIHREQSALAIRPTLSPNARCIMAPQIDFAPYHTEIIDHATITHFHHRKM